MPVSKTAKREAAAQSLSARKRATGENPAPEAREILHDGGPLRTRSPMKGAGMTGSWEWFRKDETRLRSGSFEDGQEVGAWATQDAQWAVRRVTQMKRNEA